MKGMTTLLQMEFTDVDAAEKFHEWLGSFPLDKQPELTVVLAKARELGAVATEVGTINPDELPSIPPSSKLGEA